MGANNNNMPMMRLSLQDLCELQPTDPILHLQWARKLMQEGREIAALYAAKKAYNIFLQETPKKAEALLQEFGSEILSTSMHPLVSEIYLPLQDIFGGIALACRRVKLRSGDALFWAGEASNYIYLLTDGELAINSEINGQLVLLNYLHVGGLVGESVMEVEGKRMATVIANQNCQLIRFTADELFQAFEKHPKLLAHFLKEMMLRKYVTKIAHSSLFAKLDMDLRFIVANRVESSHFKAGSMIPSGRSDENAKIIVQGVVHLYDQSMVGKRLYCGRLTVGNIFDVDKIFSILPTGISYIAETECEILNVGLNVIRDIMQISKSFAEEVKNKNAILTQKLIRTVLLQQEL